MKIYSEKEIIEELAENVQVEYKPYGTWLISSHIGSSSRRFGNDHYLTTYYFSHNEEDSIGILDGEEYNPQDFNEWLKDYAQYEIEDYEHYHDEELKELFEDYCQAVWTDSANDDNYEPTEERHLRLAKNLFAQLGESTTNVSNKDGKVEFIYNGQDNLIFTNDSTICVLSEEENDFLEENGNFYLKMIVENRFDEFKEAFKKWGEDEQF